MRLRSYVRCFEGCLELKLAEKGSCDGCTGMPGRTCLRGLVFFEGLSSMTLILGCLFSLLVAQEIFDCLRILLDHTSLQVQESSYTRPN